MAVLALVLFAVWLFQGYAIRGVAHWRRTGDLGFRAGLAYVRRVHGAAYEQYAERVGRFVPGIGRLTPAS